MDEVACYERLLPPRSDTHTDMPGSMAWRRFEPDFIAQLVIAIDPIQKPSSKHRVDAITHIIAEL